MKQKLQNGGNKFSLEQVIRELEDFFLENNERGLYKFVLARIEKPLIERVLEKTSGNKLKAAKVLGMNRNTLHSKIGKLGIEVERWKKH